MMNRGDIHALSVSCSWRNFGSAEEYDSSMADELYLSTFTVLCGMCRFE